MRLPRWLVLTILCCASGLVVCCSTSASFDSTPAGSPSATSAATGSDKAASADSQRQATGQTRALLIGVTEFIDKSMQPHNLEGPANDVELFKSVLEREPFKVPPANIRTLAGMPADTNLRPTRANI